MKRAHVFISGRVQGVFFRAETQRTGLALHLSGWVQNTQDGGVEAVFEGTDDAVEKMIAWCRQGGDRRRAAQPDLVGVVLQIGQIGIAATSQPKRRDAQGGMEGHPGPGTHGLAFPCCPALPPCLVSWAFLLSSSSM